MGFRTGTAELTEPNKSEIRFWEFAVSEIWDHVEQLSSLGSEPKSQEHLFLVQLKPESEPQSQLPQSSHENLRFGSTLIRSQILTGDHIYTFDCTNQLSRGSEGEISHLHPGLYKAQFQSNPDDILTGDHIYTPDCTQQLRRGFEPEFETGI